MTAPTTARINIEFSENSSNSHSTTEMVRLYSITEIAAEFGMTGKKLNMFLEIYMVQIKRNNRWHLLKKYERCGYIGYKPSCSNMYWTEKGKSFIEQLMKENGYEKVNTYD